MKKIINGHSQGHHWWQTLTEVILHLWDKPILFQMGKRSVSSNTIDTSPKAVKKKLRSRKRSGNTNGKKSHFSFIHTHH